MEKNDCVGAFSIERYPGPVCSYELREGEPVVRGTNEAFDVAFGPAAGGRELPEVFEEFDIETMGGTERLAAYFDRDHQIPVRVRGEDSQQTRYLAQIVSPDGSGTGHVLFTDAEAGVGEFGVDRVASVISHDLRNPLDVAKARLRAGREMDCEEHLEHVERAHDRMERIIQDVLTLARGEEVIDPDGMVDLGAVARDAWETVETNGASLQVSRSLPSTDADRDRVKRLFENLFRNAVEHGGSDGVEIGVGQFKDDGGLGFYVADNGPGIPLERRESVFDPGVSSDEHGTGLGLAIVRRIADVHGWSVSVTEGEQGGARFEITGVDPA